MAMVSQSFAAECRPGLLPKSVPTQKAEGFVPLKWLFLVLILICTYDKSGATVHAGSRDISLPIYKLCFVPLLVLYLLDVSSRKMEFKTELDRPLFRFIAAMIGIQTVASICGLVFAPGEILFSSEVYSIMQRSQMVFVPLFAARCNLPPRSVLKWFLAAVSLHYATVFLQFASPATYFWALGFVADPLRVDNSFGWDGSSWSFIGLQRTSNYGTFTCGFGLLVLSLGFGSVFRKMVTIGGIGASMFVVFYGSSRATFIMFVLALFVFIRQRRLIAFSNFPLILILLILASIAFTAGVLRPGAERFQSIYAFIDPEKEGSNQGKIAIAEYGTMLFEQSPIVGWGQRRFADISEPLGNENLSTSETHSYALGTLLSSGLVGLLAYLALYFRIAKALWPRKERDYAIVCGMFVGLGVYNIIYDAGALDVFACFNGVAAYYALCSRQAINPAFGKPGQSMVQSRE